MAIAPALVLQLRDLTHLKRRVAALAENRPSVYRMLDASGRVIYVGKAKQLRTRLLTYFRAQHPEKAARIMQAAADIHWDYVPSEFAALLRELREIRRHHPAYNVRMNRRRSVGFIKISAGPAPKIYVGNRAGTPDVRHYGPFQTMGHVKDSVRVLNDVLGLRDCALSTSIAFAEQRDLFEPQRRAACMRHELGTCMGPCAGFVTESDYNTRLETARHFIEGRSIAPLDRVVADMTRASEEERFEVARRLRERFEALTWLMGACGRVQASLEGLSFVYLDPGTFGDDRAYVIRRGTVRASAPNPQTPIEHQAFRALVAEHVSDDVEPGPIPVEAIDETVIVAGWFRKHPTALRRTVPLRAWLERHPV